MLLGRLDLAHRQLVRRHLPLVVAVQGHRRPLEEDDLALEREPEVEVVVVEQERGVVEADVADRGDARGQRRREAAAVEGVPGVRDAVAVRRAEELVVPRRLVGEHARRPRRSRRRARAPSPTRSSLSSTGT